MTFVARGRAEDEREFASMPDGVQGRGLEARGVQAVGCRQGGAGRGLHAGKCTV